MSLFGQILIFFNIFYVNLDTFPNPANCAPNIFGLTFNFGIRELKFAQLNTVISL